MASVLLVGIDDASRSEFTSSLCPNLHAFRTAGMSLTNLWSHPACSQSRGGLTFGSYGKKIGTLKDLNGAPDRPPAGYPTIASVLAEAGFQTCLVGKWHCGPAPSGASIALAPLERGYQAFRAGTRHNVTSYTSWERLDADETGHTITTGTSYATQAQLDEARSWWQSHPGPRFLHVAFNAPHAPYHIPPASLLNGWVQPGPLDSDRTKYRAALRAVDTAFGELLAMVGSSVPVFVYSDNGTAASAKAAGDDGSKMKGTAFRGGCNVFGAARWGNVPVGPSDNLNHLLDLAAGVLTVAGVPIPSEWDAIVGARPSILSEREESNGELERACRSNTYLLRELNGTTEELYDLVNDPEEETPVDLGDPVHATALAYLRAQLEAAAI